MYLNTHLLHKTILQRDTSLPLKKIPMWPMQSYALCMSQTVTKCKMMYLLVLIFSADPKFGKPPPRGHMTFFLPTLPALSSQPSLSVVNVDWVVLLDRSIVWSDYWPFYTDPAAIYAHVVVLLCTARSCSIQQPDNMKDSKPFLVRRL